jgi:hypothetical protein
MWGGVARMKHHLAGTHKNVEPCKACPDNVRETYKMLLREHFEVVVEEELNDNIEVEGEVGEKRRRSTMDAFVI